MEKTIRIEALQKTFVVDVKDVAKAKRNESYLNASPCCKAKVMQKKFCSVCNKEVDISEVETKLVKVGKEYHAVPKEKLDSVLEAFEDMEEIVIKANIPYKADFGEVFKEGLMVLGNSKVKRKAAQYSELKELAKGRMLVATGVVRKNEYQMLIYEQNNKLYLRRLISVEQLYPEIETADYPVNESVVAIEKQILDKIQKADYDLSLFTDTRKAKEQEIIETYVLSDAELPKLEITETATAKESEKELEKLNELLARVS
jgi:hypothetical protein